jgi:hypothetical protein
MDGLEPHGTAILSPSEVSTLDDDDAARRGRDETRDRDKSVDTSRVAAERASLASSRGRSQIGESGVRRSEEEGSSGEDEDEEEDDWDSRSDASDETSASSWASSSLGRVQHGAMASGRECGTMGSEGGGERGRSGIADGCDVREPSGSC